jgi:hypothetical protein
VAVTHRSVCNFLNFCRRAFMPAHIEGAVVSTNIAFDATVGSLYPPLVFGRYAQLRGKRRRAARLSARAWAEAAAQGRAYQLAVAFPWPSKNPSRR